jgi:hypothetical protein
MASPGLENGLTIPSLHFQSLTRSDRTQEVAGSSPASSTASHVRPIVSNLGNTRL